MYYPFFSHVVRINEEPTSRPYASAYGDENIELSTYSKTDSFKEASTPLISDANTDAHPDSTQMKLHPQWVWLDDHQSYMQMKLVIEGTFVIKTPVNPVIPSNLRPWAHVPFGLLQNIRQSLWEANSYGNVLCLETSDLKDIQDKKKCQHPFVVLQLWFKKKIVWSLKTQSVRDLKWH